MSIFSFLFGIFVATFFMSSNSAIKTGQPFEVKDKQYRCEEVVFLDKITNK